ncbi:MAG: YfiR family protein [Geobacter sp.]|nr:YfiR family protein [Geobacter sp.]
MPAFLHTYRCRFCLLVLVCLISCVQTAYADLSEYQIKAAMIYSMTRFMDWPDDALPASTPQFTICIVGKGGLGAAVESLQGKQVKGKQITIHQNTPNNSLAACQVLVLSDLDRNATSGLLDRSRSSALVTVADSPGFARAGGTVGFVLHNGKVRFEINQGAAQRHRIRISAQLLKLAQIVQETP